MNTEQERMQWPTCDAKLTSDLLDVVLTCDRPKGHEMDGEQYHRDPREGAEWVIGVFRPDVSVVRPQRRVKDNPQA